MSFKRVRALLLEEYFITKSSMEVIVDLFFMSLVSVIVFGLFSQFLSSQLEGPAKYYLLLGMLLWEVVRVMQYSISLGAMWEVWSHNLTNLFITPLLLSEYLCAGVISGVVKSILILTIVSLISGLLFGFDITDIGFGTLVFAFVNLSAFALAVGLIVLGIIFRYGTRIQALAWGIIFLFQPTTAVYFPVDTLPPLLRSIAYALPPTYVFEMARDSLAGQALDWDQVWKPVLLNVVYLAGALAIFQAMYVRSRNTGQFAKLGM